MSDGDEFDLTQDATEHQGWRKLHPGGVPVVPPSGTALQV